MDLSQDELEMLQEALEEFLMNREDDCEEFDGEEKVLREKYINQGWDLFIKVGGKR